MKKTKTRAQVAVEAWVRDTQDHLRAQMDHLRAQMKAEQDRFNAEQDRLWAKIKASKPSKGRFKAR